MQLPKHLSETLSSILEQIEKGQIKIPQFQRNFVWTIQKSADLIDSIVKGYPIGTFIFWKTKEQLRSIRNLGGADLPETPDGESVYFVLDGQQRLASLYCCLKGLLVRRDKKEDNFAKIYIDLDADDDQPIVITDVSNKEEKTYIALVDLMRGGLKLLALFPEEYHEKIDTYKVRINSYPYPIVQLVDAPIAVATDVFTRLNVGGKPLTVFEIMVAKTFDAKRNFDLSKKYDKLMTKLELINYETISDSAILQTISLILKGTCERSVILDLDKNEFINVWKDVVCAIKTAADYFCSSYRIPVSKLLPYDALMVLFAYFFYKHKNKPTGAKSDYLKDFFWRCSLSNRYSSALLSTLAKDIKKIDNILDGQLPKYDWPIDHSPQFIKDNGEFRAKSSYIKAILCIYAYSQPKSFGDDAIVNVSNNWLRQANSKNYHHFFPKAYLKNLGIDDSDANHILNITIVDERLNKSDIGSKAPSRYMGKFKNENKNLSTTMKTHLIDDLDSFGIWEDDYDKFIDARANLLSREIQKRIIPQNGGVENQETFDNDTEEDPAGAE